MALGVERNPLSPAAGAPPLVWRLDGLLDVVAELGQTGERDAGSERPG